MKRSRRVVHRSAGRTARTAGPAGDDIPPCTCSRIFNYGTVPACTTGTSEGLVARKSANDQTGWAADKQRSPVRVTTGAAHSTPAGGGARRGTGPAAKTVPASGTDNGITDK